MKELSEYKRYQIITIPDANGVNCLYLNNALIHCSHEELPTSAKVFAFKIDYARIELKNREFQRVNRFLTDRSLLFTKKRVHTVLFSNYFLNMTIMNNSTQADQLNQSGNNEGDENNNNDEEKNVKSNDKNDNKNVVETIKYEKNKKEIVRL
jgi:hypothetical protein